MLWMFVIKWTLSCSECLSSNEHFHALNVCHQMNTFMLWMFVIAWILLGSVCFSSHPMKALYAMSRSSSYIHTYVWSYILVYCNRHNLWKSQITNMKKFVNSKCILNERLYVSVTHTRAYIYIYIYIWSYLRVYVYTQLLKRRFLQDNTKPYSYICIYTYICTYILHIYVLETAGIAHSARLLYRNINTHMYVYM
jgi:hypothetical protein